MARRLNTALQRAARFAERFGLKLPILLAPMAGAIAPELSIAMIRAGGLGACGALLMQPEEIARWMHAVRAAAGHAVNLNLWIPDPPPRRDPAHEARVRAFLARFGPEVPAEAAEARPPEFSAQCEALLASGAPVVSSVMGLFPAAFVSRLKAQRIAWFANVSTVAEAEAADAAGADVVVAQGMEAGGHRGCFDAAAAERQLVGLVALVPGIVDAVRVPVVATGGIADGRAAAAALVLGASAVQIGTGLLRCPEARIHPAWAEALARARPEDTMVSRVFSGRAGRSLFTDYVRSSTAPDSPSPAPYPVQRGLSAAMRRAAQERGDVQGMQAWAGQAAGLARTLPAGELIGEIWAQVRALLA